MNRNRYIRLGVLWLALGAWGCGESVTVDLDTGGSQNDTAVTPAEPPNACEADSDCATTSGCSAGVCVTLPQASEQALITDPTTDSPTNDAPNLSCVGQPVAAPEGPKTATLYGAVARFGSGLKTHAIEVTVFDASTYDPSACEAESKESARLDCYRDYGEPLGSALSEPVVNADIPETCAGHSDCPLGYRCVQGDLDNNCLEQYGVYEIPNIPTNTPLVIRSRATTVESKWHDTYVVNVYLYADSVEEDGRAHFDATMVSHGQWVLTPNTVGLPDIGEGNGAIGGRVRDCRTDARDSWPISGVTMGLETPGKKIVFFNNLEDDTVPLVDRVSTNILGRFAALDIPAGWNLLSGYAKVGDENVSLGALPVYVFPNALTIVTWPGLQPHWAQK